jgi:GNAT superfamily N-acetyltransferase
MTGGATLDPATDPGSSGHTLRTATPDDLPRCAAIWRDALNDYLIPLAQPEVPDDLGAILRLYAHLQSTDPETFLVAERGGAVEAFVVFLRRERLTFLSMLFVAPGAQGRGLGRALLAHAEAAASSGTAAYWLNTGALSDRNLRIYRKAGYRVRPGEGAVPGTVDLTKPRRSLAR